MAIVSFRFPSFVSMDVPMTLCTSYESLRALYYLLVVTLEHYVRCDISFLFVHNIFSGNLFYITGHPTPKNCLSPVLWTYHGYGLCCGLSWNRHCSSQGQLYLLRSSRYLGLCGCTIALIFFVFVSTDQLKKKILPLFLVFSRTSYGG